jgi:hypothetical protein
MAKFEKGAKRPPNAGRKRGSINRTTSILKQAVLLATEQTGDPTRRGRGGLIAYLSFVARKYPAVFVPSLLARVLPVQVLVDTQNEIIYRTIAEVDREIASRGFSIEEVAALLTKARPIKEEGGEADGSAEDPDDEEA